MSENTQRSFDTAIVVTGGDAPPADVLGRVAATGRTVVIGADSGADHAVALGLVIDIAVGDFDSIGPELLEGLERGGTEIHRHRVDKDATDLELALDLGLGLGVDRMIVIGGHGGRLDHLLGNAMILADARYRSVRLTAHMGTALVTVAHPGADIELHGAPDEQVSVLAIHGAAHDVHLEGFLWSLAGATLEPGSSLGISNRFLGDTARIRLGSGTLLAIQPGDPT